MAAYWVSLRFANLAYDRALHEIAREIVLHVKQAEGRPRLELSDAAANILLMDAQDRLFFRVEAADGALLGGERTLPPPPASQRGAGEPRFYEDQVRGEDVRLVDARMPIHENAGAPVHVQVAETLNKRQRLAFEMVANVVLPQLLLIVMATAVVWVGVRAGAPAAPAARGVRPLAPGPEPDRHARRAGRGAPPLEVNDLMARLGTTFDFQNRFAADAAHQLKTPVSGLKAQIELALRESDPERVRHSLAQLYISADRLSRLVRQLLSLARNEPGALDTVHLQPLDLNAFALEVSMDWVPHAIKRNIDLVSRVQQPLTIAADGDRLRELINNLIDNAIRYSEPGGRSPCAPVAAPTAIAGWRSATTGQHPGGGAAAHLRAVPPPARHAGGRQRPGTGDRQRDRHPARRAHRAGGGRGRRGQHLQRHFRRAGHRRAPRGRPPRPGGRRGTVSRLTAGRQEADSAPPRGAVSAALSPWHRHQRLVPFHSTRRHHGFPVQPGVLGCAQIILINIVLSGDNAVDRAGLPFPAAQQQRNAIIFGSVGAIVLRVILWTFFAVYLLTLPYLKLIGAALLLWIGVGLPKATARKSTWTTTPTWSRPSRPSSSRTW